MRRCSADAGDAAVLRALTIAAAMRRPCPSNDELAIAMGARSSAAGATALARLETRGLIKVERSHGQRVVTVAGSGVRTAAPICAVCGEVHCGHSDLEFAGIVPARTGTAVA